MAKEIAEEYASSLADLTVNSKPLINMLTILAEENIDHAGVIVETVEKHLEKVPAEIKLPVLYLVDSIIKNVGGAYTQKFAQSIVSMFTRTFKQVDEKIRSQMFKLRETWHDVFPGTKLYQLDVKVNLIDPAWPIQAQPQQSNIHVNPNFLKKQQQPVPPATNMTQLTEEEEKMRAMLAKKEQELLMLQRKKVEMELEQTKRQLELAKKNVEKVPGVASTSIPAALVNQVVTPAVPVVPPPAVPEVPIVPIPVKQRLGPPVNKSSSRIAPVSAALASARRDPRLARHPPAASHPPTAPHPPVAPLAAPPLVPLAAPPVAPPPPVIAPNVFDIKPLDRATKRHNVLTIDVQAAASTPRRRDPRLERARRIRDQPRKDFERTKADTKKPTPPPPDLRTDYIGKLPDPKKISKLPPIPKLNREDRTEAGSPAKKRKEARVEKKKKRDDSGSGKESSSGSSPEKKPQKMKKDKTAEKEKKDKPKERRVNVEEKPTEPETVVFKELKNYHKERYMRRNREKSESPEKVLEKDPEVLPLVADASNVPGPEIILENKDVDLRVLPAVVEPKVAAIAQKRSSTESVEVKTKKSKHDKFDILFGSEDVDLRQLPQVEELIAPPAPVLTESPKSSKTTKKLVEKVPEKDPSPPVSPKKKDWNEVKETSDGSKKAPSKLDLVRAKLAEATKGKDRLGRPLLFTKSPSVEKERRRTISSNGAEDVDMRNENGEEFDAEDHKKTISIIMNQAKEQFNDGKLDKNQYNTLMYQVLQLNEKLKLKEAKQRESLEISKRKLKAQIEEDKKVISPKTSPKPTEPNNFGDIDERINPAPFMDTPPDSQGFLKDSDMRVNGPPLDKIDLINNGPIPMPPMMPIFMGPFNPAWRGQLRGRTDDFGPRRFRAPVPPFFRGKFDKRGGGPMPGFDPMLPLPLPTPQLGFCQGPCPLVPYERCVSPPPLGTPGTNIPPTDFRILEYIDHDPVKTIQIDGVPREIRFYGETAIIMLDWDDPREIKFLPGCRRVTFDNKDSVVISFNEDYKQVEIDDQVFDLRFGAPTRELYINGRWHECFFGGPPFGVIIEGKPRLVHLEGPLPQVDIGKDKRTDLVAGKINLIVNATQMCPVYLDAKVQKFAINDKFFTIRFVDSLRTVLINEQPFAVKYGDLPEPIYVGTEKYFIRFSALPRNIKPGHVQIANMEGLGLSPKPVIQFENIHLQTMDVNPELELPRPLKTPSPDRDSRGLDMLASLMPSNISSTPSASEYSLAEPLFSKTDKIPGLDSTMEEAPPANPTLGIIGNVNVTDLFAKLVASGIVPLPPKNEEKGDIKTDIPGSKQELSEKQNEKKEDKSIIHVVDLLKPETLRVKQPGIVAKLYGGMQCSGCGTRFPPEQTVRYSAHLDWHFRQNRRERDSARRAHSRHWHYDLPDWLQYEETELDAREKNWFETGAAEEAEVTEVPEEAPSVAASTPQDHCCALCGDKFDQFYNEDKEEWHLRNSIRFEDKNYHPPCLEDYKASQIKEQVEEPQLIESEIITLDKTEIEESIEINEEDKIDSDNESVVEVLDPPEESLPEPVEIDEGDEDDVVLKAEPIEEVVVDDDNDTDDETTEERAKRDRALEVDLSRVKKEPVEADDEPIITADEGHPIQTTIESSQPTLLSSIDGNVHMESSIAPSLSLPPGGIRINISKAIPTVISTENSDIDKMCDDISADDEPLPPGEEPELEFTVKPTLEGVHFRRQPPVQKGNELSGLCSIM